MNDLEHKKEGSGVSDRPEEALAAAWASIDGKGDEFERGRLATRLDDEPGGHYSGYIAEAREMLRRLNLRGFEIVPSDECKGKSMTVPREQINDFLERWVHPLVGPEQELEVRNDLEALIYGARPSSTQSMA